MRRLVLLLVVIAGLALVVRFAIGGSGSGVLPGAERSQGDTTTPDARSSTTDSTAERTEVDDTGAPPVGVGPRETGLLVAGRVVDAETGAPVADATVRAERTDVGGAVEAAPVITDQEGRFEIRGWSRQKGCYLSATAATHVARRVGVGGLPRRDFEIALLPRARAATLLGRVFDARAAPAEGARIRLMVRATARDDRPRPILGETGADGSFVLSGLPPGRATLHVELAHHDDLVLHVDLPAGSRTDLGTLRLTPFSWSSITGVVRDLDGEPVPDAEIVIPLSPVVATRRVDADADGRYRIDRLRAGVLLVRVSARGASNFLTVEVPPGAVHEVDLELPLGSHFLGGVVTSAGAPAAGLEVICEPVESGTGQSWTAWTDAEGRFRVDGLVAGPKLVNVMRESPWKIEVFEGLALDRDDHVLEFPPVPDPVRVEGTVTSIDGAPIAGALVEASGSGVGERAHTDVLGRYALELRVTADEVRILHATHPEFRAERSTVQPADAALEIVARDFRLTPLFRTGAVEGVVLDATGRPVAGAVCVVTAQRDAGARILEREDSDSLGRFRIGAIPEGSALLRVGIEGEDEHQRAVEIRAAETLHVEFRIDRPAGATLHVRVRDESGRPVSGASVAAWRASGAVLRWGTTDEEGRLTLEDVRVGAVRITAEVAGAPGHSRDVELEPGGAVDVVLDVVRGPHRLEGVLLRPDGSVAPSVEIEVRSVDRGGSFVNAYLYTDHEGRFVQPNLPAGRYELDASTTDLHARREVTLPSGGIEMRLEER